MRILALAIALTACTSHYLPRAPGRVAVTMRDGRLAYVRDGVAYDHGFFGGGLSHAVAGNPAAEAAAYEYRKRVRNGLLGMVAGLVVMVVGSVLIGIEAADPEHVERPIESRDVALPLAISLAGVVVIGAGGFYAISAEPYRWDAINLFNDGAWPGPPLVPMVPSGLSARVPARAREVGLRIRRD